MNAAPAIDGLYHQALGFPAGVLETICQKLKAVWGFHAKAALAEDRYLPEAAAEASAASLPTSIQPGQVIEVEVAGGAPVKFVARVPFTRSFDLVVVVSPRDAFVRTAWLNRKSDQHKTLNASAYRKP